MSSAYLTSHRHEVNDFLEANELYHERGWSDGLPIIPPTEDLVLRFLEASDRDPSDVLGVEPVRGRVLTVEKAAINAVMAGCKPEYFPVVVAAAEAICEDQFNLHAITASTMGAAILIVVNGPVVRQIGLNSGINVFGPGRRANATIGRALRLIAINVIGAIPGELDKATFGHAGKYSWCIAEAEEESPWEPLHVERGLSAGDSAVSVFAGLSPWQATNHVGHTPEAILTTVADVLKSVGPDQGEVLLIMSPEHVGHIRAARWSKRQVKEYLAEKAQRTVGDWAEAGRLESKHTFEDQDRLLGVCRNPDSATIVVAGGAAGAFVDIIPLWGSGTNSMPVTRAIEIPHRHGG